VVNAGITEIGMIVGDTEAEIRAAVGDGSRWGRPRHLHPAVGAARPGATPVQRGAKPISMALPSSCTSATTWSPEGIKGFVDRFEQGPSGPRLSCCRASRPRSAFGCRRAARRPGDRPSRRKPEAPEVRPGPWWVSTSSPPGSSTAVHAITPLRPGASWRSPTAIQWLLGHGRPGRALTSSRAGGRTPGGWGGHASRPTASCSMGWRPRVSGTGRRQLQV